VGGKESGKEKGRREKKKREKRKKEKRKEDREGNRELPARFVAAVGHARAATLGRSTTCTQNVKK